jgi:hypothetical protein
MHEATNFVTLAEKYRNHEKGRKLVIVAWILEETQRDVVETGIRAANFAGAQPVLLLLRSSEAGGRSPEDSCGAGHERKVCCKAIDFTAQRSDRWFYTGS